MSPNALLFKGERLLIAELRTQLRIASPQSRLYWQTPDYRPRHLSMGLARFPRLGKLGLWLKELPEMTAASR